MHTFAMWAYAAIGMTLLVGFVASIWDYAKAWDIKFDKAKAEKHQRKINWETARKQQTIIPLLGLPLGLIVVGLLAYHLWVEFSGVTYTFIAIGWFLSAPLRRLWQYTAALRVDRKLRALGLRDIGTPYMLGAWSATKLYYQKGSARKTPGKQRKLFVGRLQWVNNLAWLWKWAHHLRVAIPLAMEALMSLIWPFTAMVMVFHHSHEAGDHLDFSPWWERGK